MRTRRANSLLEKKNLGLSVLKKTITRLKTEGKIIVFTNGCFDLLHYGHAKYLQDARRMGDILVVAVNSDSSVRKLKGRKRPIVNEKDRVSLIAALACVDYAVLFAEDTPIKLIKLIKPDILVKGSDWNRQNIVGGDFVLSYGGRVATVRLIEGRSTTDLIKKIVQVSQKK